VPWYVTVFLKMVSPFIDPVTKTKMRYNEPLPQHIPTMQLTKAAGGDCDFQYDHAVYWPALAELAAQRRKEREARWEKAGKHIGESEVYLWGGEEGSLFANEQTATEGTNGAPVATTNLEKEGEADAVADGVEKL
jgi:hypothetical protein